MDLFIGEHRLQNSAIWVEETPEGLITVGRKRISWQKKVLERRENGEYRLIFLVCTVPSQFSQEVTLHQCSCDWEKYQEEIT